MKDLVTMPDSATASPKPRLLAGPWRVVDVLLIGGLLVGIVAGELAVRREKLNQATWWDGPGYLALEEATRGIDRAIFLIDDLSDAALPNTRLHSTQYAIIPAVLDVEFDWAVVFGRLDAGEYLICDFSSPDKLDAEIQRFRDWATKEKRDVIADRISRNIAILKAGERP